MGGGEGERFIYVYVLCIRWMVGELGMTHEGGLEGERFGVQIMGKGT